MKKMILAAAAVIAVSGLGYAGESAFNDLSGGAAAAGAAVALPAAPSGAAAERAEQGEKDPLRRGLTAGEKKLLEKIFADGIDYSKVTLHHHKWLPFQSDKVAMSPNGSIYLPEKLYLEDFSVLAATDTRFSLFVHEMGHVYQDHQGVAVAARRLFEGGRYRYTIAPDKDLNDYTLEAQADIIGDYAFCIFMGQGFSEDFNALLKVNCVKAYSPALDNFLKDPKYLRADEEHRAAIQHERAAQRLRHKGNPGA
ncbi:MAG: hypothetical protein WCK76_12585 [Elusimicrobiota bacterium]